VETRAKAESARRDLFRARFIAAVCAGLTLVAIASAIYGYINQRRAQETRQLAETSRGEAEKLVGFLLDDFYDELVPTGRLEIVGQLAQKAVTYYDALPAELRTPATERNRAMALMRQSYVVSSLGDNERGEKLANRAIADFEKLRAAGDQTEETLTGLALAMSARANFAILQGLGVGRSSEIGRAVEMLRPVASKAGSSRRTRREFANILNWNSHLLPRREGIAICEEALQVLAGLGATDMSDLSAASAYGDVADSAARHALKIGDLELAERLENESDALATRILAKRPGDLRAMLDRGWAPNVLGLVEARRFHADKAMEWAGKYERAIDNYVQFNPSDGIGWQMRIGARNQAAEALFMQGRITDAVGKFRAAIAMRAEAKGGATAWTQLPFTWDALAILAAQQGDRAAADAALREALQIQAAVDTELKAGESSRLGSQENHEWAARRVQLAFGEFDEVHRRANQAIDRINGLQKRPDLGQMWKEGFDALRQFAWSDAAHAALRLGRDAEAEKAARAALNAPLGDGFSMSLPATQAQAGALLALAQVRLGQAAAARGTIETALRTYRELRAQEADSVDFCHDFGFALYVQAVALAGDEAQRASRRAALDKAAQLLDGLTSEAKAMHDQRELMEWIAAERAK
jgi:hypothetical protein